MEKVRPWCGQPSDRGRLRNRTDLLASWSQAGQRNRIWLKVFNSLRIMVEIFPVIDESLNVQRTTRYTPAWAGGNAAREHQ